ncbi:FAD-dependent monooxygenase [Kitasatospora sp. NPDC048239]|uniref:FAD-dependent monooxygenase n=1 Tax=Kitasatospora sp. NPDC048239 TaxID=3364046 RepID=UPI00371A7234
MSQTSQSSESSPSSPANQRVVIAGAGPTGLLLAAELRLAGVETVILERLPEASGESRGLGLHVRSLEILHQRGLVDRFRTPETEAWPAMHFGLFWLQRPEGPKADYTLAVPQWKTEHALEGRARELGTEIRRGHEVTGLSQDDERVVVEVEGPDGPYRLEAAYLVGADGGHSRVRKLAGIGFPGTGSTFYGVLGDVIVKEGDTVAYSAELYPGGWLANVPIEGGRKLRLMTTEFDQERPGDDVPVTNDELREAIKRVTGTAPDFEETTWLSRFGNSTRLADEYRSGRVLLAGDAAHVHYPIGGQGLNTGLQDAFNLGWKLAATVQGRAPEGLLDTYHAERRPVGQRVCVNTQAQVSLLYPLEKITPLREIFAELVKFKEVNDYLLHLVTGVGTRYEVPLPEGAGEPHALLGRLVPDAELVTADGPTSLASHLHDGRGLLIRFAEGLDAEGWTDRVDVLTAEPHPDLDAAALLIRPDGHIAAATDDPAVLRHALTTWFGAPADAAATDADATADGAA